MSQTLSGPVPTPETPEDVPHHERRTGKRDMTPKSMQLNLTSMIDVIFQLLIYFVITANFVIGEGIITAKLPKGSGAQTSDAKMPDMPLNIRLTSLTPYDVRINIEGTTQAPQNFTGLQQQLVQLQFDPGRGRNGAYKPDNPVIIKPDGRVRWQHVVNAFNAAVASRYSNVSFAQASDE